MSEHKKVHFFCEEDVFSLDILFYRQRDGFARRGAEIMAIFLVFRNISYSLLIYSLINA